MDLIEWYFGSDVDVHVVPKDYEPLDMLPSPDNWSGWGLTTLGSSEYPKRHFNGKSFRDEVDINISGHEGEHSSNSSTCHGLHNGLLQWTTLLPEQPDYLLNDLARIDQTDDIFLSSLLEEDLTSTDNLPVSSSFSPESHYSMTSADNHLTDMILESQNIPSHTYGRGSSKYLKRHAFSPVEWDNGETTSCLPVKAPVVKFSVLSDQDSVNRFVGEETSLEESVLQELEMVTSQLTEKTRTCFRDALYRLAQNSKQQLVDTNYNGDLVVEKHPLMMVHDETLRLGKTEATESKTNAIDRAIANLLFNKMDFSARDHLFEASLKFKLEEAIETTWQFKQSLNQRPNSCNCPPLTILAGDAEVPIIRQENPRPQPTILPRDF